MASSTSYTQPTPTRSDDIPESSSSGARVVGDSERPYPFKELGDTYIDPKGLWSLAAQHVSRY